VPAGVSIPAFATLTTDDVINAVWRLPNKSSAADAIPTAFLKQVIDLLSPFVTELFNRSFLLDFGRRSSHRSSENQDSTLPMPLRIDRYQT